MVEIRKSWRTDHPHKRPKFPETFGPVEADDVIPTRFFDQLSVLGDEFVLCYVLETSEGIVLIDCLYPYPKYVEMIETGLKKLELDPKDITAIVITHGHFDHFGQADYFRDRYGAKIYMSETDYLFARAIKGQQGGLMQIPYEVHDFIKEGDELRFGESVIHVLETPGHSPGGLSFIFNVTDEGRPHMVCLWGGTGVPRTLSEQEQYLASAKHFEEKVREYGCDVEISNHPDVDCSLLRFQLCREISNGVANPFVIGKEACVRYAQSFYDLCKRRMENPMPPRDRHAG